jgi:hypothetical protein
MKKLKLLLAAAALVLSVGTASAREDVTATYLTDGNLSALSGWTIDASQPGHDTWSGYTDHQTNGAVNVLEFYSAWNPTAGGDIGNTRTFDFSQMTKTLPQGYYRLKVNGFYREGNNNPTINQQKAYIYAGTKQQYLEGFSGFYNQSGSSDLYKAAACFGAGYYENEFDFDMDEEGQIQIGFHGYIDTYCSWCIIGPVTLYKYEISDFTEDFNTKKSQAEALYNSPMKATVLATLQEKANVDQTVWTTKEQITAAESELNAAINAANASIAYYAEAKAILDAANGYDASGQASYAADETIVAIQAAYDNGTLEAVTNEQKAAAQAALATACKDQTQPADGCDMTAYIVNPNIDGNADGWTTYKSQGYYSGGPMKPSNDAFEFWAPTMDGNNALKEFDYYQTISELPTGAYEITASMLNSTNGEANAEWNSEGQCGVYGKTASDEKIALVTVNSETYALYTTEKILVVDGNLRIGVKNISPRTGQWFSADNFKLTYVRQLTAEEEEAIAKANAVAAYEEALDAAKAIEDGSIPSTVYTNLQTVIANNTLTNGTSSDYNAAATALSETAAAAQALVAPYTAWKELKAYADALVLVANDNDSEHATLVSVISTQEAIVEAASATAAGITDATSTLETAMVTYAGVANPVGANAKFDLTFMLTNPNLEGLPTWTGADGWHTEQTGGNSQVMTNGYATSEDNTKTAFYEYWKNPPTQDNVFALYQEVTLTEGTYNMSCYAFAQYEQEGKHENIPNGVYFYANDVQGSAVNNARLSEQSIEFVNPSEQEVKIGLKPVNGNGNTWMGIGYVKLYKVPAKTFDISEDAEYDKTQEGAGTVTLNRTIKAGYNTLVLPFSMTQAEVEDKFGKGSIVYVVKSYDEDKDNISFTTHDGISANMPCLLDAKVAGTSYTFENRTIVAGEPVANGKNVSMTGTYSASLTVPEGNYIISGGKIYEVDGQSQVSLKGTRAYITIKSGSEARTLTMSFDDTATGIATLKDGKLEFETGDIYDLSGRKVKNPTKGIYLMNGKKVIK